MEYSYLVRLSNSKIYKEVQLPMDRPSFKIGMSTDCDARLYKGDFFESFELQFTKTNDTWQISSSENVYISFGGVERLIIKDLEHGDKFTIRDNNDNVILNIEYAYDFDNENKNYDRVIDISSAAQVTMGGASNNNIVLNSKYAGKDSIVLTKKNNDLQVKINTSKYGVYHDGKKAKSGEIIHSGDFLSVADFSFYYFEGKLYAEASTDVAVNGLTFTDSVLGNNYPKFNRNTRINLVIDDEKIEILDPPSKPQKPKNNILTRLLPSLVMVVAGLAMAFVSPFMLVSSGIGVVTAIMSLVQSKKDFKTDSAERIEKYNAYIANKKIEIENYRKEELDSLEKIYISQAQEKNNLNTFSSDLFDRTNEDEDFLCVRLGNGQVEAKREIDYKKQEKLEIEDDLQLIPEQLSKDYKCIDNAPVVCDFKLADAVGVVGPEVGRYSILKNIVIDITARHYFKDVKLVFIANEEHKNSIKWFRMLPHVYNDVTGTRNIVLDDDSKTLIFEYLYKELATREQNKKFDNRIVVFFFDEYGFNNHPISKFVDRCKDMGITFVFFGETKADIPIGIDSLIEVRDKGEATLIDTHDGKKSVDFTYPIVTNDEAEKIVNLLAPVYSEELSLEGSLTKSITLFELLNIIAVDDVDIANNWANSKVYKSMAAPLGVSKSGVVELDLHDKAHGPHGLVAGTTGSGKSEVLQSYILAMSLLFPPEDVGFVIIDFKGGGMAQQFRNWDEDPNKYRNLPHILGTITDIDGKEIARSLKSIKAELDKRKRLFAEAAVNHIDAYIKKYKAGEVSEPIPHLIIIVDEFAELKADQPEFMKELISAARIGRSLGVHLILATQKPAGQVDDQIWSNSRFKLCLKVQSSEDSNEVIKSPLAAEIKEPGRAYLQVGNNEIFELFQSGYSGGPEKTNDESIKEFKIFNLTDSGRRELVFAQKNKKSEGDKDPQTQLGALVKYIDDYCKNNKVKDLSDICLPSLPKIINFPKQGGIKQGDSTLVELGVYDDPDNQYQGKYTVDLSSQNVMIIGSSQSGKTNLLQTMIRDLTTKYSPSEVNIYIIDFASMVLKNFENLNHVGGVVTSSEDEKLKNLIKLIQSEISSRKEKLLEAGVSSFAAYREAGKTDLAQIVLMIDNLTALKELYFQDDDELLAICREGNSVGISVVIANSQTTGIGYKYLSNFPVRIAMFCNDSGEYSSLFDHCRERIDDIHGRCLVEIDNVHIDCQIYLAYKGEKEFERVEKIRKYTQIINEKYSDERMYVNSVPVIPTVLEYEQSNNLYSKYLSSDTDIILGLNYENVSPVIINCNKIPIIGLSGREGVGCFSFINYFVSFFDDVQKGTSEFYVIDSIEKQLLSLKDKENVVSYEFLPGKAKEIVESIDLKLANRYEALANENTEFLDNEKFIILLVNSIDAIEEISSDTLALNAFNNIIGKYKNLKVLVFVASIPNAMISYTSPDVLKAIRETKQLLIFDDVKSIKIVDPPYQIAKKFKKSIEPGDCYYISENEFVKLKVPYISNEQT